MLLRNWMRLSSVIGCILLLAFMSIICTPSTSSADVLAFGLDPQSVGFATTHGGSRGGSGNIIDFAVLRPNSAFDNVLGSSYKPAAGSPAFDSSKWTYLYQVANAAPIIGGTPSTIQSFGFNPIQQSGVPNLATSVGTFDGNKLRFDFTNQGTIVNAQGNNLQSVNAFGINSSPIANSNGINVSTTSSPRNVPGSNGLIWNFSTGNFATGQNHILNGIQNGQTSPVFGFQSDASPRTTLPILGSDGRVQQVAFGPVLNGVIQTSTGFQQLIPIAGAFNVPFAGGGWELRSQAQCCSLDRDWSA